MRVLVLQARKWDMVDKDTGEVREGTTVHVLEPESAKKEPRLVGCAPYKVSGSPDLFEGIKEAPAWYDVEYGMRPGKDQKPMVSVVGLKFLESAESMKVNNGDRKKS